MSLNAMPRAERAEFKSCRLVDDNGRESIETFLNVDTQAERMVRDTAKFMREHLRDSLVPALEQLQDELNYRNATDVVCGCINVPLVESAADEAAAAAYYAGFSPGGNSFVGEQQQSAGDSGGRFPITLPLALSVAEVLEYTLDDSPVGIENQGDVIDYSMRQSLESTLLPADPSCCVSLPMSLLRFDFPEARRHIREAFCGGTTGDSKSTEEGSDELSEYDIVFKPYKFVLYRKGDFFAPHSDSMSDARQIGSLSVQVPIMSATEEAGEGCEASGEESDRETHADDDDSADGSNPSGAIVFYLGRQLGGRHFNNSATYASYGRPKDPSSQLKMVVDLSSRPPQELPSTHCTVKYAAWLGDIVHEVTRVTSKYRGVLLYRLFRVPIRRAVRASGSRAAAEAARAADLAWMGPLSLCYEKNPSQAPASLLLRGMRLTDPRVTACEALLKRIMRIIAVDAPRIASAREEEYLAFHKRSIKLRPPRYLGVVLRHPYPPAGLVPIGLKGGDAALYAIASREYEVTLHSGYELRSDYPGVPYRVGDAEEGSTVGSKLIVLTTERLEELTDLDGEDSFRDAVCERFPAIIDGAWMQQGFGKLLCGGHAYGNCDCGSDWWYRSAVMIVHPAPSRWRRRMPLFLLGLRGPKTFQALMEVPDVFMHIMSFI